MENKMKVPSPVVPGGETKAIGKVYVKDIAKLYQDYLQVNVTDFFKGLEYVDIMECCTTGYRFYFPFTIAGDGLFYAKVQRAMEGNNDYYRSWGYDHQFAYNAIGKDESVLDIGCGSGNFLTRIKEKTSRVYGLEFNPAAIEQCRAAGLTVYADSIEQHAGTHTGMYDVVCLFQVLEHIDHIKPFLDASLKVLRKGGKLIIGVPNNEPFVQGYHKYSTMNLPPHHMGMWNRTTFEKIQPYFGIKLKEVGYEGKGRWTLHAYYMAKYWLGIKSMINNHTFAEKLKMLCLAPLTAPISIFKKLTTGLNGAYIVVMFEKE
jgi:2-polyprenyl-3-methyl-5-hydroxy-6-metoxy-1,4-benzoquinol methylase